MPPLRPQMQENVKKCTCNGPQRTFRGRVEIGLMYMPSQLERTPQTLSQPHQWLGNFSIMMECTPEIGNCHYVLWTVSVFCTCFTLINGAEAWSSVADYTRSLFINMPNCVDQATQLSQKKRLHIQMKHFESGPMSICLYANLPCSVTVSVRHLPEFLDSLPESIPVCLCLWGTYLSFLILFLRAFQYVCYTLTWISWDSSWEHSSMSVIHLPEFLESLPESIPVCLLYTYLNFLRLFLRVSHCICETLTWVFWVSFREYPIVFMRHLPEFLESLPESIP